MTGRPASIRRLPRDAARAPGITVIILAGGRSTRMGQDKARLRLQGRSLLAWVRAAAQATGWPVRVVRRDLVARCGPLGGVWTAFQRCRARRLIFLSCDMPFVSAKLIRAVGRGRGAAIFTHTLDGAGFPFALERVCQPVVAQALAEQQFALQALAQRVKARSLRLPRHRLTELRNLNTPAEFARANALARPTTAE